MLFEENIEKALKTNTGFRGAIATASSSQSSSRRSNSFTDGASSEPMPEQFGLQVALKFGGSIPG
jgi:hypothetical protein